jgi:hypothetical protein
VTGNGAGLAAQLRARGLDGRGVVEHVALHIPQGRDELKSWVRWSYPPPCTTCGLYPLHNYVASRRAAARAVGDDELAKDLGDVMSRLRPLLERRHIAVPLALLSELSPP